MDYVNREYWDSDTDSKITFVQNTKSLIGLNSDASFCFKLEKEGISLLYRIYWKNKNLIEQSELLPFHLILFGHNRADIAKFDTADWFIDTF